jgi:hypothetical protein
MAVVLDAADTADPGAGGSSPAPRHTDTRHVTGRLTKGPHTHSAYPQTRTDFMVRGPAHQAKLRP